MSNPVEHVALQLTMLAQGQNAGWREQSIMLLNSLDNSQLSQLYRDCYDAVCTSMSDRKMNDGRRAGELPFSSPGDPSKETLSEVLILVCGEGIRRGVVSEVDGNVIEENEIEPSEEIDDGSASSKWVN